MAWNLKKFTKTLLSGMCSSYAVDKINDLKEATEEWLPEDFASYNHTVKTGEFKLEYRPRKDKKQQNDNEW